MEVAPDPDAVPSTMTSLVIPGPVLSTDGYDVDLRRVGSAPSGGQVEAKAEIALRRRWNGAHKGQLAIQDNINEETVRHSREPSRQS